MGFPSPAFGFNEPTLTTVAYVSYLLAFLLYTMHLLTGSGRVVVVARGHMVLAGAGMGRGAAGSVDISLTERQEGQVGNGLSPTFGRVASGLVLLAWVSLTTALALRWIGIGHPPYVILYEIATMLV